MLILLKIRKSSNWQFHPILLITIIILPIIIFLIIIIIITIVITVTIAKKKLTNMTARQPLKAHFLQSTYNTLLHFSLIIVLSIITISVIV